MHLIRHHLLRRHTLLPGFGPALGFTLFYLGLLGIATPERI